MLEQLPLFSGDDKRWIFIYQADRKQLSELESITLAAAKLANISDQGGILFGVDFVGWTIEFCLTCEGNKA